MSKEIETCGEVDRGFGKVLCLLYLLEKENLMKIREYLSGLNRLQIEISCLLTFLGGADFLPSTLAPLLSILLRIELSTFFYEQTTFRSNTPQNER